MMQPGFAWPRVGAVSALRLCLIAAALTGCSSGRSASDFGLIGDASGEEGGCRIPEECLPDRAGTDAPTTEGGEVERPETPPPLVVVTFNTGTSLAYAGPLDNEGFHEEQHAVCDEWYGNGLSWKPFVEDVRALLADVDPDIVVFQEVFWSGECAQIPPEFWPGFVCEDWTEGALTVAQLITGHDYQVACHPGKPDKCAAVHHRVGKFRGCEQDFCLEGLAGHTAEGCGKGARIGRGVIDLVNGSVLTLVNIHASSGMTEEDMACRVKQFDQVFVDLGDGLPAVSGAWNLAMGDFNTDPGRLADSDPSAARIVDFVGPDKLFRFVTEVGPDVTPTYGGFLNIDHVVSDVYAGTCWTAGVTLGRPRVTESVAFDHRPIVCTLELR